MVEEVVSYKTSDGDVFLDKKKAELHESSLKEEDEFLSELFSTLNSDSISSKKWHKTEYDEIYCCENFFLKDNLGGELKIPLHCFIAVLTDIPVFIIDDVEVIKSSFLSEGIADILQDSIEDSIEVIESKDFEEVELIFGNFCIALQEYVKVHKLEGSVKFWSKFWKKLDEVLEI